MLSHYFTHMKCHIKNFPDRETDFIKIVFVSFPKCYIHTTDVYEKIIINKFLMLFTKCFTQITYIKY